MRLNVNQKFQIGDLVRVTREVTPFMRHFPGWGELAICGGSHKDQFGGAGIASYTLVFPDHGLVSWYDESLLTLVKRGFLGQFVDAGNRFVLDESNPKPE